MNLFPPAFRLVLLVLGLSMATPAQAVQIIVAKSGNDATGQGTEAQPFASPDRARTAARAALLRKDPVEVIFHQGTYELKAPLELGPEDSGTTKAPAIWRAAKGDDVRLSGGRLVSGWKPVTDPAVLKRLDPTVRGKVFQVDLAPFRIADYGEMTGGFGITGGPGLELFVNDLPARISRYPNEGFIKIVEVLGATLVDVRGHLGTKEGIFRVEDPRVAKWAGEEDPRAFGFWCWDWADQRQKIARIDTEKNRMIVRLAEPWHSYGYSKDQYFYGFNLLCEIDQPGEWYLNRKTGILYLYPPGGVAPKRAMVSILPTVVKMRKASSITLDHLIVEGSRDTGISITDSEACRVENGTIRNVGGWAVQIVRGHRGVVERCAITSAGSGGVWLEGGDRTTLTPALHLVENCDIHAYSRWNRTYQPGIRLDGVGCRAAHNAIYDAPHQAIGFGGNDQVMEFNDIHDVCQETNDAGAIYAWNDWAARGNRVSANYIHHVVGFEGKGANGVYLDDNFSSALIQNNVFKDVMRAIHLGGGRDHRVENNLFIDCPKALHIDARGLGWRSYGFAELKEKLEIWPYKGPVWSARYPELVHLPEEEPMAPRGVVVSRNILISCPGDDIEEKAKAYVTMKDNLLDAPRSVLAPPVKGIPRVDKSAVEVREIGFQDIPVGQIGIEATPAEN